MAEALKKIPKAQPDVVLMDIQLPDSTGVECTAKLKEQMPAVHIVIVTVYEDSERIFQALRAGACGYLLKRAEPEKVIAAIQEAQRGRRAHDAGNRAQGDRAVSRPGHHRRSRWRTSPTANGKCWNW